MTYISAFVFDQNEGKAASLALALLKVNKILRNNIQDNNDLDGIDCMIDCIIGGISELREEFEKLKYWAEDVDIKVRHARYHGKETLIHDYSNNGCKPEVAAQ